MTLNLYNDNNPESAAILRELVLAGEIPPGVVDCRSIEDFTPNELDRYTQCHFFAGIGGWSRALRLAEYPEDMRVWTASCPCQPFSASGKRGGFADERHLWPTVEWLISQCRPELVFGEQVASPDGLEWFDLVSTDLEAQDYAVAAVDLCAAGFGAPHVRQRLYWAAYATGERSQRWDDGSRSAQRWTGSRPQLAFGGAPGRMANVLGVGRDKGRQSHASQERDGVAGDRAAVQLAGSRPLHGSWRDADWILGRDGLFRPVEPGSFPMANGVPARMAALHGYGNAIVPEVAEGFIRDFFAARADLQELW